MHRPILSLVPLAFAALATPALAACPQNHFAFSNAAFFSSLPVDNQSGSNGSANYNVPQGTVNAFASCGGQPECGSTATVYVEDDFTLTGLPDGTPVPLVAHFKVSLSGSGGGFFSVGNAIIQDTHGNTASAGGPKSNFDLTLGVAAVTGTPFRLHFESSSSASGSSAFALGNFSFTGLPPGTALTSCQGYAATGAVPARSASWGQVKTLYR